MATKKAGSAAKTTRSKSQTKVTTVQSQASKASTLKLNFKGNAFASVFIAEFVGVFALVSAFLVTKGEPLYMGFVLIALVLMVGSLSGSHLNPLVTAGAWVTRRLDHLSASVYLVAQLLGAGAAFVLMTTYLNGVQPEDAGLVAQPLREVFSLAPLSEANRWFIFFAEVLGASLFAFAFASVYKASVDRVTRALTIGFGFFIAALVAGVVASYVGGQVALNPASALAASAVDWSNIDWFTVAVFLGAPLVGGVVGFVLRDIVETK